MKHFKNYKYQFFSGSLGYMQVFQRNIPINSLFEMIIITILFILVFLMFNGTSLSGDAAVYFTFFKHFFNLPFSFQPNTVSFGATSPLHVFITATIVYIFQDNWFFISKLFQYILIAYSAHLLYKTLNSSLYNLLTITLLIFMDRPLLGFSIQLYETALAFFGISLLYYYMKSGEYEKSILVSGSLYLVRPELFLISISVITYLLVKYRDYKKYLRLFLISLIPVFIFHLYMYICTGEIIPSSISARIINALENNSSWINNFITSVRILKSMDGIIYLIGFLSILTIIIRNRIFKYTEEFYIIFAVIVPYIIISPGIYTTRYLIPVTPILIILAQNEITSLIDVIVNFLTKVSGFFQNHLKYLIYPVLNLIVLLLLLFVLSQYSTIPKVSENDFDMILLKDLAIKINSLQDKDQEKKILIYEIQGQYFINSFCYSLDGIVGNQMNRVLLKKESEFDLIRKEKITYIVTSNSFNYRKVFRGTLFEKLFVHDLNSNTGDSIIINGISFIKLFSNPYFENPQLFRLKHTSKGNVAEYVRVYNDAIPRWGGKNLFWNSVYRMHY